MEEKLETIKNWLGTGAVNVFGLPMSGKDTQGIKLAEVIGGKFISSGMIIRAQEQRTEQNLTANGQLIPTNIFYDWVLPYLEKPELKEFPLVLSSIGRWKGEENEVMERAERAGHKIKAAVLLNISEADVERRFYAASEIGDRGERADDRDIATFKTRILEFRTKTMPVLEHYRELGLLVVVNGDQTREAVFREMIEKLVQKAQN